MLGAMAAIALIALACRSRPPCCSRSSRSARSRVHRTRRDPAGRPGRPARHHYHIGIGVALQGVAVLVWAPTRSRCPPSRATVRSTWARVTVPPQALWVVGTSAVLMCLLYLFFMRTYLGKAFRPARSTRSREPGGHLDHAMRAISFSSSALIGAVAGVIIAPIALMQYDSGIFLGIKGSCLHHRRLRQSDRGGARGLLLDARALATGYLTPVQERHRLRRAACVPVRASRRPARRAWRGKAMSRRAAGDRLAAVICPAALSRQLVRHRRAVRAARARIVFVMDIPGRYRSATAAFVGLGAYGSAISAGASAWTPGSRRR